MAFFSKDARQVWLGIAIGGGGLAALPFVAPIVAAIARPFAKALLTQGLVAIERSREKIAHLSEGLEDILAEVRVEAADALNARTAAAREAAGDLSKAAEPAAQKVVN